MDGKGSLIRDSLYRIKLLKAGFTDKEIERLYIMDNNIEVTGVNWCNCNRCKSFLDEFIQNHGW